MSALNLTLIVIAVVGFTALVALSIWMRRWDDEEFEQGASTISDDERRRLQVGIGLVSGGTFGGAN
jgi:hypothetical protein